MARTITEAQKTETISVKEFATLDPTNYFPGIKNTVYTVRDETLYLGNLLTNTIPYTAASTDLVLPTTIGTGRISGAYMFDMDSSNVLMVVKVGVTISLYAYSSGVTPSVISTITTLSTNREVYLEAIFCSTEKASTTGYVKYAFLNLPGEAWVVAYNTRIGAWQIEKVNNTYSVWVTATNYALGNRRIPTVANGYYYEVSADAGSSGGVEPTWPTTIGDTVVDSGITWICRGRYNNFPTTTSSTVKTLNGYIFVVVDGDIYNSDLDLPDSWNTSDFISTEIYPDSVVALAKYKNYLVAFGQNTIEFFYDAANVSGSPLARQEGVIHNIGCVGQSLVADLEDRIYWVSQTSSQNYSVWTLENFKVTKVSSPEVDTWLTNGLTQYGLAIQNVFNYLFIFLFRLNGRLMLGIPGFTFGPSGTDPGFCYQVFVLDLDLSVQYYWEVDISAISYISRPFTWKNYFLWPTVSSAATKTIQLSSLTIYRYDNNSVVNNETENLFSQAPSFISKRLTFNSLNYKSLSEIAINGFPSLASGSVKVTKDRGSITTFTIPSGGYKITRLGRAREFQLTFSDIIEVSSISFKYTEHTN